MKNENIYTYIIKWIFRKKRVWKKSKSLERYGEE